MFITLILIVIAGFVLWILLDLGEHDIEDLLELDQEKHDEKI